MKVLLMLPQSDSHYLVPPVNLGYLATAIRNHEYNVKIIDGIKENLTLSSLKNRLKKLNPDVIGITIFSCDVAMTKKYLRVIKKYNSKI